MTDPQVTYTYFFTCWDDFASFLVRNGFERYEWWVSTKRGYKKGAFDIDVPYHAEIPNRLFVNDNLLLSFFDPNEIPQSILNEIAQ